MTVHEVTEKGKEKLVEGNNILSFVFLKTLNFYVINYFENVDLLKYFMNEILNMYIVQKIQ